MTVWIVDLGLTQKTRPALVLSSAYSDQDRALITVVAHATKIRGSKFELPVSVPFLKPGAFVLGSSNGSSYKCDGDMLEYCAQTNAPVFPGGARGLGAGTKSPGPKDRGRNFFSGGNSESSSASRSIDVSDRGAAIDSDKAAYDLPGWLRKPELQRRTHRHVHRWKRSTP